MTYQISKTWKDFGHLLMQSIRKSLFFFTLKNWKSSIALLLASERFLSCFCIYNCRVSEIIFSRYSIELENFNCLARERFRCCFEKGSFNVYCLLYESCVTQCVVYGAFGFLEEIVFFW